MKFIATEHTTPDGVVFNPLSKRLKNVNAVKLAETIHSLQAQDREIVINRFMNSFASGNRMAAFACSEALTKMEIPPAFRLSYLYPTDFSLEQKIDLLTYDIRWIRRHYPEHKRKIRYGRYKELLSFAEGQHHTAIEYVFYAGKRPSWKIVSSLSLPESIQFECCFLQSAPVTKYQQSTNKQRNEMFLLLQQQIKSVRRTKTFTDADAKKTLMRRHRIWLCSRMSNGNRIEIAKLYRKMTGEKISAEIVARQLCLIEEIMRQNKHTKESQTDSQTA